jgi:hypothetical protein
MREENRLKVFERRFLRKVCGPRVTTLLGNGGDCMISGFMI